MISDDERPRIFGTARAARAWADQMTAEQSDGARAYALELTLTGDDFVRRPYWIVELELGDVVVGRLCRDGTIRPWRAPP